jgi:hypothetical protein
MAVAQMNRAIQRTKISQRKSDRSRLPTVLAISMTIASAGLFASQHIELKHSAAQPKKQPNDDEIYTGSILFVPNDGKICRQLLFDNRKGLINDNGLVDCAHAYYRSATDMQVSAAGRAQIISESFRGR